MIKSASIAIASSSSGDAYDKDAIELGAAVRLLLYIFSRLDKPLPGVSNEIVGHLQELIFKSRCSLEISLLAGSAIAAITVTNSSSDEDCIESLTNYLNDSSDCDLNAICHLNGILTSVSSVILLGHPKNSEKIFIFTLLDNVLKLCRKTTTSSTTAKRRQQPQRR